ncbi:glycosyltransferase [Deefgea tanakiae]|uniref:Glycosyltransferase n=1 Tax=Deefgea tanakiae TaxID=2865840 RepID=A0ABX8Z6P9_9NEIS|nr:glycosyltransferase [Deefgea tanakiae]QZA78243.1 glycosyltransferase [Deefgea tanakiae]
MIVFLIDVEPLWKTGLYNAVVGRLERYSPHLVLNISYADTYCLTLAKHLLGKGVNKKRSNFFVGDIEVQTVVIPRGFIATIMLKLPFLMATLMKFEAKIIKKELQKGCTNLAEVDLVCHWGLTSVIYASFMRNEIRSYYNFFHGSDVHTGPVKKQEVRELIFSAMNFAKINFFVSKGLLHVARQLGYQKDNVAISYNGIDLKLFKTKRHINAVPVVGYAGNLLPVKGADLLPAIFDEIRKKVPMVQFKIAGDGFLRDSIIDELASRKIDFNYLGKLQPEEMAAFYSTVDVLIMPSRNEGLPLAAVECIAAECNLIATNVGGLPEVVASEFLVNHSDNIAYDFAKKVAEVLILKPKQTVSTDFDIEYSIKRELDLILIS